MTRNGVWCAGALCAAVAWAAAQEVEQAGEAPGYVGRALLFEADLERGRALGWIDPSRSDERALAAIEASLRDRVRTSGRFIEAQVAAEEGHRFSVTFVGRQAPQIEEFLVAALGMEARLALVEAPEPREPGAAAAPESAEVQAERERLAAWLAADPERTVVDYRLVTPAEGGAPLGLSWAAPAGAERSAEAAVALSAERMVELSRASWSAPARLVMGPEQRVLLVLEPDEGLAGRLAERFGEEPRPAWLVLDGQAFACEPGAPWNKLSLDLGRDLQELRPLLMALGGEPMPAPLRFVGFEGRPLRNVRFHVPGDDD